MREDLWQKVPEGDHQLNREEFEGKLKSYIEGHKGEPIPRVEIINMIQCQEKFSSAFLDSDNIGKLISEAEAILVEMGYEREGRNWIKTTKDS